MKRFFQLLLICILSISLQNCLRTYYGSSSLSETNKNASVKPIKKVLIVGVGSMPSRVFLSNLSKELSSSLAQNNIQSNYNYIGQIPRLSHVDINKIKNENYDSYLILTPVDTSFTNLKKDVGFYVVPLGNGYRASGDLVGNQYKEKFYVDLYTNTNDSAQKIWQGILTVDFDFGLLEKYKKIAREIVDKMVRK